MKKSISLLILKILVSVLVIYLATLGTIILFAFPPETMGAFKIYADIMTPIFFGILIVTLTAKRIKDVVTYITGQKGEKDV